MKILQYADTRRYPNKAGLLREYYTLVEGMETTMGLQNDKLIWLKNHFKPIELELQQIGLGSTETKSDGEGREASVTTHGHWR